MKSVKKETREKITELQKKVNDLAETLRNEIHEICEQMDYKNSSKFSLNVDRLDSFTNGLCAECYHDFIPLNNDGKHECRFCGEIED